ncbi:MAG: hypothetical protein U1E76_02465 [Planctomycetota bacterium]
MKPIVGVTRHVAMATSCLILAACGSAFRSAGQGRAGASEPSLTFALDDGSTSGTVQSGDVITFAISADAATYSRLEDALLLPDPDRVVLTLPVDIGSVKAGDNLIQAFRDQGFALADDPGGRVLLRFAIDTQSPWLFPEGSLLFALTVTSDAGAASTAAIDIEVLAGTRPTLSLSFEQPASDATPTGKSLPVNGSSRYQVGHTLPFALILRATPNPETNAGFKFRKGSQGNDAAISITADQDLGDPGAGGIAAGTNLAPLITTNVDVIVDDGGVTTTGYRFDLGSPLLPLPGVVTFTGHVTDRLGASSLEQSAQLEVQQVVSFATDVVPLIQPLCTQCHGPAFRIYLDMDLSPTGMFTTVVGARAGETPDDSCATLRIAPYDPDASYCVHKIQGTHLDGCVRGSGQQMPAGFDPLPDDQIATIRGWILQGCFDD